MKILRNLIVRYNKSEINNFSHKCKILFILKAMATPEKWDEIQETKNKFDVARCGFVEKLQTKRMRRYATHSKCDCLRMGKFFINYI